MQLINQQTYLRIVSFRVVNNNISIKRKKTLPKFLPKYIKNRKTQTDLNESTIESKKDKGNMESEEQLFADIFCQLAQKPLENVNLRKITLPDNQVEVSILCSINLHSDSPSNRIMYINLQRKMHSILLIVSCSIYESLLSHLDENGQKCILHFYFDVPLLNYFCSIFRTPLPDY